MSTDELVVAVAGLAVVTVPLAAVLLIRHRARRLRERLAPVFELGTCRGAGFLGAAVVGLFRGYPCRYRVQPASHHSPGGATLRLAVSSPLRWSAERAGLGVQALVRLRLLGDVAIGDVELDRQLRFSADDEGGLVSLAAVAGFRETLTELLGGANFVAVEVRRDRLEVRWRPRSTGADEDPVVLRRRLAAAARLAAVCSCPPRLDA